MSSKYQSALFGGLFIGVMSGLPLISAGNVCCCLWVIAGGVLAMHLQQKSQPTPVESSQAVLTGLIAGAVGAVIAGLLNLALLPLTGPLTQRLITQWVDAMPNIPPEIHDRLQNMQVSGAANVAGLIIGLCFSIPMYAIFAMLGALLGRAMFKPKNPPVLQA
jgi:hypothetical protein